VSGGRLILLVDDNAEDQYLTTEALRAAGGKNTMHTLDGGEELLAYLRRDGEYAVDGAAPRPDLILLDLNMPRMSGHETLAELRKIDEFRNLPVIVFSTSAVGYYGFQGDEVLSEDSAPGDDFLAQILVPVDDGVECFV